MKLKQKSRKLWLLDFTSVVHEILFHIIIASQTEVLFNFPEMPSSVVVPTYRETIFPLSITLKKTLNFYFNALYKVTILWGRNEWPIYN